MSKESNETKKSFWQRFRKKSERDGEQDGVLTRLRRGLKKTRSGFLGGIANIFGTGRALDEELIEALETRLLMADVGIEATDQIIAELQARCGKGDEVLDVLKDILRTMLADVDQPLVISTEQKPFVILVVGVNGVGKTTTIGKLAHRYRQEGYSVMLAAGDTFRAAAVEQLQTWGQRHDVPVIAQHTGADSASVIYDALASARAKGIDVLIADTAGRLHNKDHLMEELAKIVRVIKKLDPEAPHETLLVLDAGTGQNALSQARAFSEAVPLTGLALTKLDGTAKGGILFALAHQFGIPIRFIGVGEQASDLRPFDAHLFVEALFDDSEDNHS